MKALETVAAMKAEHEAKVAAFDSLSQDIQTDLKESRDLGFDEGIASAGTVNQGDKIYSEEELQAELTPLKAQIQSLQASVDAMPAQIEAAVKAKGLEIAAKIRNVQVDDLALAAELEA